MKNGFLDGYSVALSISRSPDLAILGLGNELLEDAMAEIARHPMACGATLAYGGDLRDAGFTQLLFEIVSRLPCKQGQREDSRQQLPCLVRACIYGCCANRKTKSRVGGARAPGSAGSYRKGD